MEAMKKVFNFEGTRYTVETRVKQRKERGYGFARGNASVWHAEEISTDAVSKVAQEAGASTIYTKKGEFLSVDKAWREHNRKEVAAKRALLLAALAQVTDEPEEVEANFSRTAGCRCGCSPGFILPHHPGLQIFVSKVEEKKAAKRDDVPSLVSSGI